MVWNLLYGSICFGFHKKISYFIHYYKEQIDLIWFLIYATVLEELNNLHHIWYDLLILIS